MDDLTSDAQRPARNAIITAWTAAGISSNNDREELIAALASAPVHMPQRKESEDEGYGLPPSECCLAET
jgi:hypothetical protein